MGEPVTIRRALLSVFDKTGIVELGQALHERGVEILSTGGTAKLLKEAGVSIVEVGAYTGHPEMLDGRVKTLHPKIHGGLLGRRNLASHRTQMDEHDIGPIDLVAVNLYPFEAIANKARTGAAGWAELIENIDIGGPSMLRSAAKNHDAVTVVCNPSDYQQVIWTLERGGPDLDLRTQLALKAFQTTAAYDGTIASVLAEVSAFSSQETLESSAAGGSLLSGIGPFYALSGRAQASLRYGENPHQKAAIYQAANGPETLDLAGAAPLQGKALSYNNLLDAEGAVFSLRCLTDGARADAPVAVAVMKHATPCGAARADDGELVQVWDAALSGDPVSAFGGIVASSQPIDGPTATRMSETFLEVVIAPGFSNDARAVFAKKKNLRLLAVPNLVSAPLPEHGLRSVPGGFLVQQHDRPFAGLSGVRTSADAEKNGVRVVTKRAPTEEEWQGLDLAFRLCASVKSNAITLCSCPPDGGLGKLLGAGGGQTSRVDAARLAVGKAGEHGHELKGAALGSDAFFPFPDALLVAADAGVAAFAQPGGSKRDVEVIQACDERGLTMVFTGERHFRH